MSFSTLIFKLRSSTKCGQPPSTPSQLTAWKEWDVFRVWEGKWSGKVEVIAVGVFGLALPDLGYRI
jgi:hypothetical protein